MQAITDYINVLTEGWYMDFVGQKRAERLFQIILTLAGVIGLAWGYSAQELSYTIYTLLGALCICALLVLPPWPMYRCNNLPWQKAVEESSDANSNTNTKSSKKKK